jgi:chaperonin GroES
MPAAAGSTFSLALSTRLRAAGSLETRMITPLSDRIIVERVQGPKETPGGILLPDTAKQETNSGRVVAVGPGKLNKAESAFLPVCPTRVSITADGIEVGDVVHFSAYSGNALIIDDKKYLALSADDIIGFEPRR